MIYLLRHGETADNRKKIYSTDHTRLTEVGIEQIIRGKDHLPESFGQILVSPLDRTIQTMNILYPEGKEYKVDHRIKELDFGKWKGLTFSQCGEIYPEDVDRWMKNPYEEKPTGGESLQEAFLRIESLYEQLKEREDHTLLITHDGIIRLFICKVLEHLKGFFHFSISNGGIVILDLQKDFQSIKKIL